MSRFLDGISTIISIFHKYAKEDGDCSNLSQRKMQELIQKEFADVIAKPRDPQTIDKILQFLEWDGDGHIDFNEFLLLVFRVAKACYWFQPKGPYLQQRTKLTSSGKLHQEPEIKNRGRDRQLQEEEEQTCESNHHPPCEPELQQDIRVNELEILEETVSYQQRNTQSVNDAKQSSERREPIPQVYEEQSQEPCDQRNRQRRCQPPAPNRRGDVQVHKHRGLESHEPRLQRDERKYQEGPQQDQLADIRSRSQTSETRPLQNRWGSRQPNEPVGPAKDGRNQRPQEADRGSDNRPRKPELLTEERSRYHLHELEQRALEESSHKLREPECLDLRGPHQSYIKEPLEIDLRYCNTCELERHIDEQRNNEEHNIEYVKRESEKHKMKEWEKRDDARRKGKAQERRVDIQRELDLKVYEDRSHQTREKEQAAKTNQRERRERRDFVARATEIKGRTPHHLGKPERTQETDVVKAEADVKIHRVSWKREPHEEIERREHDLEHFDAEEERNYLEREREKTLQERRLECQREQDLEVIDQHHHQACEREERGATNNQRKRSKRRDFEAREAEIDGRRQCEQLRLERTQEADVVAAEADVKIHRMSRELEPRKEVERRERDLERFDAEEERRIYLEREREEPLRERRLERQRELDLEVIERSRHQVHEKEERGANANQRERRDFEARAAVINRRRQRDLVRLERTQEADVVAAEADVVAAEANVVAAEADVKIHRVSRELEPREEVERRERDLERFHAEEERRVFQEREIEEPTRERRVKHQRELDLEVYEERSCQTREWQERGAKTNQKERRKRRDFEAREAEINGRRHHEMLRLERTQEADIVAAEADVRIHCMSRELEPREEVERREREFGHLDAEEERRVYLEKEREEPLWERRLEQEEELDLDVIERRCHQAREREQRGTTTNQRERSKRRDFEARAAEIDGRRQRDLVRLERTQEADVVAAEADVKIHRVSRELEPLEEVERRERDLERFHAEEERRVFQEREIEEPTRESRVKHQRELDLEVYEERSRQTREWQERGARTNQRERRKRRDFEAREAEIDGRRHHEMLRLERTQEADIVAAEADVKIHRMSRELEPRKEVERREREFGHLDAEEERRVYLEKEREEPLWERRLEQEEELDLDVIERRRRQAREREQRGTTTNQRERSKRRDFEARAAEIDGRRQRDLVRLERTQEADVVAAEADVKIHRVSRELEPLEEVERRERDLERFHAEEERRVFQEREIEEPTRESRVKHQRELDLEVYEERSRQTREWQERGARTNQRERRKRRDFEAREAEIDGRRHHEMLRLERTQEADIVAAEADVKIHRMSRELEPRKEVERREREFGHLDAEEERRVYLEKEREEPLWERRLEQEEELDLDVIERRRRQAREREQRGTTTNQRERSKRRDFEARAAEIDGRRQRDLVRLERTQEADVVAAEADVKIHRVSRELEPLEEVERRERDLERFHAEEERRVFQEREIEEPTRESRVKHQRELDLEVYEERSRQTREWQERGARTNQRERRKRRDFEAREAEIDGRRHHEMLRLERTQEADIVAAEADVKIHRMSRELEPRKEVERREREFGHLDAEEERRVYLEKEREEPLWERRLEQEEELDLDVIERRRRQAREREQRGTTTNQRERSKRRDFEARAAEIDGRRQRDLVRLERTQEADVVVAEADVKIHRVSRELEPLEEVERRERDLERFHAEEERRVFQEREIEEPTRESRVKHQRELDLEVYEERSRQTREWQERGARTNQRERRKRRDFEAREAEIDGRRHHEMLRLERTQEADIVAAEADVKIHRMSRELEPRKEVERREREFGHLDAEEERRVYLEKEREEPLWERRLEQEEELDLDVIERRRRQAREREQRGTTTNQRERSKRRDFEARAAEIDGRRQRDLVRLERTQEADVVAAEADVKIHRVSRELEPRKEVERREHDLERFHAEEERRVFQEREIEEPTRESRVKHQRELDLEVYEERSRQTREWQERGARTNQRERRKRRDFEACEAEINGRRHHEMLRLERTQEADIVAAEADVKIHRMSRELEPRKEVERREREFGHLDAEEERRVYLEKEREEPLWERRLEQEEELDLDVIERRCRQAREREQRGTMTNQRERSKRRDFEAREAEIDGRRQRDLVRLERTREADVVATEADVKIHRMSRELEPRKEVERRERDLECFDAEEESRLYLENEREEPLRERRLERKRELDLGVVGRRRRQAREREQRGTTTNQTERRERRNFEAIEAEIDGRRQREQLRLERTREADVVAAEADVKIHRVSRLREPRVDVERREREFDHFDAEEERRLYLEKEREEPLQERRLEQQRELDLVRLERTREADVVAAEADVKIHRVSRELELREEIERRERDLGCPDAEEERRLYLEREREEPLRERRLEQQRELDLEAIECRHRQAREREQQGANANQRERCERRDFEAREAEIDGRRQCELLRLERTREANVVAAEADVKIHHVSRELEPREEVERRELDLERFDAEEERRIYVERGRDEPLLERRLEQKRELDLEVIGRHRRQAREREERGATNNQRERSKRRDFEAREAEIDGRRQRDLVRLERTREADVVAAEADVKIHRVSRELEPRKEVERRERDLECFDAEEESRLYLENEREEPLRERRLERQRELDLEVVGRHRRQAREWEERGATNNQRERRDFEARAAEINRRRQSELLRLERTREADVVAAEADVKIYHVSRELEPREEVERRKHDRERLDAEEERRVYRERELEEAMRDRRLKQQQEQDLVRLEKAQEADAVAAEADVKIHRVSQKLKPHEEVERRECDLRRLDAEEDRRVYLEREREEPLRERRLEQQEELDLEVIERRCRQAREREERGTTTNQRERRERRNFEAHEAEIDGRRQREQLRLERTREADVVAAEADVKIHRVSRLREPRVDVERREREFDHFDAEEERRLYLEKEREEPLQERRLEQQRELDLEVIECRRRQAREREEQGVNANQRERCDFEARAAEIDGRRQCELLRLERTREADVVAAEADVKIHRVSRELEPRKEVERRERDLEHFDAEEERRIYLEKERDEPLWERRLERQRELDLEVTERHRRQACEREERGATNNQRERCDFEAREAEIDGRRQRELLRLKRTREANVAAAEADVKIHRVSRELEPREEVERRERDLDRLDAEGERRIYLEREREEPLQERRLERQRELDLEVIERSRRQVHEREEQGATTNQRERRDFEAMPAEPGALTLIGGFELSRSG